MQFNKSKNRSCLMRGLLLAGCGLACLSSPAFAQGSDSTDSQQGSDSISSKDDNSTPIVVTGSRIRKKDFEANSPIVTVDTKSFEETSSIGVDTIINELPQFVPAVTQFTTGDVQNSATNTVGASTVSLRGLGPNRNLVLLDGRRAMPVNAALVVDTNSIPSSAIQRVEIISGGASAVYGADAVGGVVNFILKKDFEGLTVDGQYGITEVGDSQTYRLSGLWGANFGDGRGNVMFGMEYADRGQALAIDRKWRRDELASPTVPGTEFFFGETRIVPAGFGPSSWPTQDAVNTLFPDLPAGTIPRSSWWYINPTPDGTGTVFTGTGGFFAAGASAPGAYKYDGPLTLAGYGDAPYRKYAADGSISENQLNQMVSIPLTRYSFFGRAHYEIAPGIRAFGQANFSKTKNRTLLGFASLVGAHSVFIPHGSDIYAGNGALGIPSSLEGDGITTNPLYTAGGTYGLNCPATGGCTNSQAFPLGPEMNYLLDHTAHPNSPVTLWATGDFLPARQAFTTTTTFQVLAGFEGEFGNGWAWDTSYSHGETDTVAVYAGFLDREAYRAVASAPNFGVGFSAQDNTEQGGNSGGSATCTSGLPLLRDIQISQDCIDAITAVLQNTTNLVQDVAEANVTGDLFKLPAGPLQFALGATWRKYDYIYRTDHQSSFNNFLDGVIGRRPESSTSGGYNVKEVYGELVVPILADVPGVRHFNLELGGRYSDYSTIGSVWTYKILGDWAITDWLRLRGGYNKATRAPNIGELYLSGTQVFGGIATSYGDQCSENNTNGPYSANPAANVNGATGAAFTKAICSALMGPTGASEYYSQAVADQPTAGSLGVPNYIGNPDIGPETAQTWTAGLVIKSPLVSPALSGIRLSVDWYQIEIKNLIALKDADTIMRECLDPALNPNGDITTLACQSIERDTTNGTQTALFISQTNEGRVKMRGLDIQFNWTAQFQDLGMGMPGGLGLTVLANVNLGEETQAKANAAVINWKGTQGCALGMQCMGYTYKLFTTLNYFNGPFNATIRWQHYPSIKAAAAAANPSTTTVGIPSSYDVFNLSGAYRVTENFTIRAGVDNLFNREPPLTYAGVGTAADRTSPVHAGGGIYSPLGRSYYIGVKADF